MFSVHLLYSLALALSAYRGVQAETHSIVFVNDCGAGTPTLVQNGVVLSTGATYTVNGPFINGIAFLQTGNCGPAGENCSVVKTNLTNPTCASCGSSTEIDLAPPYGFSAPIGFGYFNGCDGLGHDCTTPACPLPGSPPGEEPVFTCQADNVDLAVTFCD